MDSLLDKLTMLIVDDNDGNEGDSRAKKVRAKIKGENMSSPFNEIVYGKENDEDEANEWKDRSENSLPKYLSLCREVYRELTSILCERFGCMSESNDDDGNIIMVTLLSDFAFLISYGFPLDISLQKSVLCIGM